MSREMIADGPAVSVRVPAKLNLFLAVRGRLDDGYHELVTVLQTVSVFDELRAEVVGPPGRGHHPAGRRKMPVEIRHDRIEGLPDPRENLATSAAVALGRLTGMEADPATTDDAPEPRTVVRLRKNIPVAGGMAGGSADAAAALVGLNELWGCDLSRNELRDLAEVLGSDVPFCVVGGTALATGRGTALARVLCRGTFHWVICQADKPLSTADVYRSWDRSCRPSQVEPDAILQALRSGDAVALGAALHNDLEAAACALRPELEADKKALVDAGALGAVLSGSGPTMLALAADADGAQRIAADVADRFVRVVTAHSPAGGPELWDDRVVLGRSGR